MAETLLITFIVLSFFISPSSNSASFFLSSMPIIYITEFNTELGTSVLSRYSCDLGQVEFLKSNLMLDLLERAKKTCLDSTTE